MNAAHAASRSIAEALALADAGRVDQAIAGLKRVAQRDPRNAEVAHFLGLLLSRTPALAQAEFYLRRAIELNPNAKYHANYANVLAAITRHADAERHYREAIALDPAYAPAWIGLGGVLLPLGRHSEAEAAAREAVRLDPSRPEGHVNLAMALLHLGRAGEALDGLRRAADVIRAPGGIAGLVAFLDNYVPGVSREQIFRDHVAAGRAFTPAAPPPRPALNDDPERRLRVAYLSPDLREHSVARFVEGLFTGHDRAGIETVAVSTAPTEGATYARLRGQADRWLDAHGLSDDALAARLRAESIDILVELSGLSTGHRLGAVARRPAPVICTYIGYPNTTGVPGVAYRIVDAITDPPGAEAFATETLARLDRCFLCYTPPADAPAAPPRAPGPTITFASFNAQAKVNDVVLGVWARVLSGVPGSRLLIKPVAARDAGARARYESALASRGISPARLDLVEYQGSTAAHLALYGRADIALDTFPYCGTTTTCEALWMGVPVVTLRGETHAGRVGASLLTAAGLPEFIASDAGAYVRLAADLAKDAARLAGLRATLRQRLLTSSLCDPAAHCRALERVYRAMWRQAVTG